jgi:cytochrome b
MMRSIKVWDLPTRLFHWLLVLAVAVAYVVSSGRPAGTVFLIHVSCGYLVVLLLLFRFVWGFVGGQYARFAEFVRSPDDTAAYLRGLVFGKARRYLGHNPAAGIMIVLLLATLTLIVVSGLLAEGVTGGAGPLAGLLPLDVARTIGGLHKLFGNLILVLVGVHVLGVIVESLLHRENLAAAMVSGRKTAGDGVVADARPGSRAALIVLVVLLALLALAMAQATTVPPPRQKSAAIALED